MNCISIVAGEREHATRIFRRAGKRTANRSITPSGRGIRIRRYRSGLRRRVFRSGRFFPARRGPRRRRVPVRCRRTQVLPTTRRGKTSFFRDVDARVGEEIHRVVPDIFQHLVLREEDEAEGGFRIEAAFFHLFGQIRNDVFHRLGVVVRDHRGIHAFRVRGKDPQARG